LSAWAPHHSRTLVPIPPLASRGLGDRGRAIELLERSRVRGIVRSPVGNDMHSDPFYDVLRGDPRFERISRGE
jgi:hypothetical protein